MKSLISALIVQLAEGPKLRSGGKEWHRSFIGIRWAFTFGQSFSSTVMLIILMKKTISSFGVRLGTGVQQKSLYQVTWGLSPIASAKLHPFHLLTLAIKRVQRYPQSACPVEHTSSMVELGLQSAKKSPGRRTPTAEACTSKLTALSSTSQQLLLPSSTYWKGFGW